RDGMSFIGKQIRSTGKKVLGCVDVKRLTPQWERVASDLPGSVEGDFDTQIACANRRVFVGCGRRLIAISDETAVLVWSADLKGVGGPPPILKWNPMVSGGLVVINTGSSTAAFEGESGRLVWKVAKRGARAIYDGRVYLVVQGSYVVLDLRSGKELLNV